MWESFWETTLAALAPIYGAVLAIAVPAAIAYALKLLRDKTGIEIEARHREALQTAVTNAAGVVVARLGGPAAVDHVGERALQVGVDYVRQAVPDAVAHFERQGLDRAAIADKIFPKAEALVQSVPTTPPAAMSTRESMDAALAQMLRAPRNAEPAS